MFRARPCEHDIILRGNEPDRRRQKRLDAAFEMLNDVLDQVEHS